MVHESIQGLCLSAFRRWRVQVLNRGHPGLARVFDELESSQRIVNIEHIPRQLGRFCERGKFFEQDNLVTRLLQLLGRCLHGAKDRRRHWPRWTLEENSDGEALLQGCGMPGNGYCAIVKVPWLGLDDRLEKESQISSTMGERACHRDNSNPACIDYCQYPLPFVVFQYFRQLWFTGSVRDLPSRTGLAWPPNGIRSVVGLKPKVPQQRAGILIEPPISVPTPRMEPLIPTKAPSPPLLPPAVIESLYGF